MSHLRITRHTRPTLIVQQVMQDFNAEISMDTARIILNAAMLGKIEWRVGRTDAVLRTLDGSNIEIRPQRPKWLETKVDAALHIDLIMMIKFPCFYARHARTVFHLIEEAKYRIHDASISPDEKSAWVKVEISDYEKGTRVPSAVPADIQAILERCHELYAPIAEEV